MTRDVRHIAILAMMIAALGGCQKEDSKVVDEKKPIPTVFDIHVKFTAWKDRDLGQYSGLCDTRQPYSPLNCDVSTDYGGFAIYPTAPTDRGYAPDRVIVINSLSMSGYDGAYDDSTDHLDRVTGEPTTSRFYEVIIPYKKVSETPLTGIFRTHVRSGATPEIDGEFSITTIAVDTE